MSTQVTEHNLDGNVGAHRNDIRIHDAAGGISRIAQQVLKTIAALTVEIF